MDQQQAEPGGEHASAFVREGVEYRQVDLSEEDVVWAVFAGADGDILVDKHDGRGLVRPRQTANGEYRMVTLRRGDGGYVQRRTHRLIACAYHGPAPTREHTVDHADGLATNNHASNLRWATHRENRANRSRLMRRKDRSPRGRLRLLPVTLATVSAVQAHTGLRGQQLYSWVDRALREHIDDASLGP